MKKLYTALLLLLICFSACEKTEKQTTTDLQISQTSSVATNQPVTFSLPSVAATETVKWSAKPETVTITPNGNSASIIFKAAGSYTVTGVAGNITGTSSLVVKDTVVANPLYRDIAFAAGEQINLTVAKINDTLAKSGISFYAQTTKKYNCKSSIKSSYSLTTNTLTITFTGINEPSTPTCTGTTTDISVGGVGSVQPVSPGTTVQLVVNFNGTQYTGSISKSANGTFTITWPYTAGIVVSPLSL